MTQTRRTFLEAIVSGAVGVVFGASERPAIRADMQALAPTPTLRTPTRVAAIQMTIRHGKIDDNLATAERLIEEAIRKGAKWIVLPEFFASGYGSGNDPAQIDAARPIDGAPADLLKRMAQRGECFVGGSFLAQRQADTYNTFVLAMPDGSVRTHDKDTPSTGDEASNYIGRIDDDGLLEVGEFRIGAAMCWELIRCRTARRLREKVDLVLAGTAYFVSEEFDSSLTEQTYVILRRKPGQFARLVGAPVVLASGVGRVEIGAYNNPNGKIKIEYMGASQIVNAAGETLAMRSQADGEGVAVADLEMGRFRPLDDVADRLWIPEVPQFYNDVFHNNPPKGAKIYQDVVRPHRNTEAR
jgi:predicted amidohydrolase